MGYWHRLTPISAKFVREVENLTPESLDAYLLGRDSKVDEENPFGRHLCQVAHVFLGRDIPSEAFQYGKPLFNRPETQEKFWNFSPYVVTRRSLGILIDCWYGYLVEAENVNQYKKANKEHKEYIDLLNERLRTLRILERRFTLFILYGM